MIFSILVLASLIISLIATPVHKSLSYRPQSKSYTHTLSKLERRGGSVSSRSSSSSSLESETTNPPDAPVLKSVTIKDKWNQGQKKKISRSEAGATQKAKRKVILDPNPAAKIALKIKQNEWTARSRQKKRVWLEANPSEFEAERKKVAEQSALYKIKRDAQFVADPAKKTAFKLKRSKAVARRRKIKRMRFEVNPLEKEAEREKKAEQNISALLKRRTSFVADPAKKIAWRLKERKRAAEYRLKKKMEKIEMKNVADIMMSVRGRKSVPLVDRDDKEERENYNEAIEGEEKTKADNTGNTDSIEHEDKLEGGRI
jgi:hypothetical protein